MSSKKGTYPECEKLRARAAEREILLNFVHWLTGEGIDLCDFDKYQEWSPIIENVENSLILRYFGIDLKKLEEERRALLQEARKEAGGQ